MSNQRPMPTTPPDEAERLKSAAKHLQDNPLWKEALDKMEAEYIDLWRKTDPVQTTQRELAYHMVGAIGKLRQQIQSFAQAGKLDRKTAGKNINPPQN